MKVSCLCPTYGRPPRLQNLLEESVESFLRQDYPDKELLILNDRADQELKCDAPGVIVVNIKRRFRSLGEKYNAMVALTEGELLTTWEDDDISLPWRLSMCVEKLGTADYYNPRRYFFMDANGIHKDHSMGVGHNCSIYTRKAFDLVGGYPFVSGAQDAIMDGKLSANSEVVKAVHTTLPPSEWYFIYRWGVSPVHLSGRFPHDEWYKDIAGHQYESGLFELKPQWYQDYLKERNICLAKT